MTGAAAKDSGVRARGRAAIAAGTLRTDRWWAYPVTTFTVLLAFVGYVTYATIANRDYYAAPYISPFYSPCLSFHCGAVPGSAGAPHLGCFGTWWIITPAVIILVFPLGFRLTCYYYRKAYYDPAIRWNCKAGKCGSCSAEINGRPKLLCMTRLSARPRARSRSPRCAPIR